MEFYTIVLPDLDPKRLAKTHHRFQQKNFHLIKIFPETKHVLKNLKNAEYLLAAVSNRNGESLIPSLKFTEIFEYFDAIVTPDDVLIPKPHQDHPLAALNKLQVKTENAYLVGDTENDILAGKNAKIKTVGVTYGWLGKDIAKYQPDFVIDKLEDLLNIVR